MSNAPDGYLTMREWSERSKISRSTSYTMLKEGRLRGRKLGGRLLIPDTELQRILDTMPVWPCGPLVERL